MEFRFEDVLLVGSILLLVSIIASKTLGRIGVPVLLMFLGIGMLAGSDGIGGIYFDNPNVAQSLGIVSLTLILFSGGLDTKWEVIRPVLWRGIALSTLGIIITTVAVGMFVHWVAGFSLLEGLLLGAIVSSTDAAAVFSILRSNNLELKQNLRPTLELESGSNDPMAYLLTISLTALIRSPDTAWSDMVSLLFKQLVLGGCLGYVMGRAMRFTLNRIRLQYEGLYPVLLLAMALFTFSVTDYVGGNGFLAIYLSAIILSNGNFIHKRSLIRFYDGLAWLMQILMFLTLGLLVFPTRIVPIMGIGILISLFLIFVARPAGVFASLLFSRSTVRERLLFSWVGLRGAAPIVFATYPLIAGLEKADLIFHIVFFIVFTSVLLQGTTLPLVARWLRLDTPSRHRPKNMLGIELPDEIKSELITVTVPADSQAVGKSIVQANFPKNSLIVMIHRDDQYLIPNGSTVLFPNDNLLVMTDNQTDIERINASLDVPKPETPKNA